LSGKAISGINYSVTAAPGFQTSVRKVRVTPEIAARIRRGEEVSPDEIAKAAAEMEAREETERNGTTATVSEDSSPSTSSSRTATPAAPVTTNEWLPDSITNPKKRAKGKRK